MATAFLRYQVSAAALLMAAGSLFGQSGSLTLSSASGSAGSGVSLAVSLNSGGGAAPAGLQWTLNYPAASISTVSATAGPAGTGAGKSLNCALSNAGYSCVLTGMNATGIADGVVATLNVTLSSTASGTVSMGITNTMGSTPDGSALTLGGTAGAIAVSAPAGTLPSLSSLTCSPGTLTPPATSTCTVTLTAQAPAGGVAVALASSNPALTVPASVTVSGGSATGSFTATGTAITSDQTAVVTATVGVNSVTASIGLTTAAAISGLQCSPSTLGSGAAAACTVTLSKAAPAGGAAVLLTSSNASLTVPASVTVAAGASSAGFNATAGTIAADAPATVTASWNGSSVNTSISLAAPAVLTSVVCSPSTLGSGAAAACTVTLSKAAPAGGAAVSLASSSASLTAPASVTVAAGATTAAFNATAGTITANTSATITAAWNGTSRTATESLTASTGGVTVSSVSCTPSTLYSGGSGTCTITLSAAVAASTNVAVASNNAAVTVPASVAIYAGYRTASVTAAAGFIGSNGTASITASLNSTSAYFTVTLQSASSAPVLQLHADSSEVNGVKSGSTVTPSTAPNGFKGKVVVNGTGSVNFAPAQAGNGVYFLPCCKTSSANSAYYKFAGASVGSVFNVAQGQISFYMKSRYSFAQRIAAPGVRYAFDVRDDSNHLFYFITQTGSNATDGNYLFFSYAAGGNAQNYFVPRGTEETLFGSGVIMKVTLTWAAGSMNLYLNDALVKASGYTAPAPNWTANSNFDLGAYEYLTFGGSYVSDDIIDEFTVSAPSATQTTRGRTSADQMLAAAGKVGSPVEFDLAGAQPVQAAGLPMGASFDQGAGHFAWTPGETQTGTYDVAFTTGGNDVETVRLAIDDGRPAVTDVVNAASRSERAVCSAGSVAALLGKWLAGDDLSATRVRVNGEYATVVRAGRSEVDFLCPAISGPAEVVVETAAGATDAVEVTVLPAAPGLFSLDGSGMGQGDILFAGTALRARVEGPGAAGQPAHAGDVLAVRATGFSVPDAGSGATLLVRIGDRMVSPDAIDPVRGYFGVYEVKLTTPEGLVGDVPVSVVLRQPDGSTAESNAVTAALASN